MSQLDEVNVRPFAYALSFVEGKWKMHILFWLWKRPVMRYSELKRALEGVSHKMLSSKLKELEADGLIVRHEYPQVPPKVELFALRAGQDPHAGPAGALHLGNRAHRRLSRRGLRPNEAPSLQGSGLGPIALLSRFLWP